MEEKKWYTEIYTRLKRVGVKTNPIARKLGVSRTAVRLWFDDARLEAARGRELASALDEFSLEVKGIAKEIRRGFSRQRK